MKSHCGSWFLSIKITALISTFFLEFYIYSNISLLVSFCLGVLAIFAHHFSLLKLLNLFSVLLKVTYRQSLKRQLFLWGLLWKTVCFCLPVYHFPFHRATSFNFFSFKVLRGWNGGSMCLGGILYESFAWLRMYFCSLRDKRQSSPV